MMNAFKNLTQDRGYFVLVFICLTFFSYLAVYFSLVYDKPDYIPVVSPYLYIPFCFVSMAVFFLSPHILFSYFLKNKEPLLIFLFGLLLYISIFVSFDIFINNFWIKFHYFLAYCTFGLIVSYSVFISVRSIFSDEE